MNNSPKVLWREGLFLTPQHFQAWDQYHEWLLHNFVKFANPYNWGVYRLKVKEEAIAGGEFAIVAIEAVMRDGTLIDSPAIDIVPPSRTFSEVMTPDRGHLTVYLGLAREGTGHPAVHLAEGESSHATRYERSVRETIDMVSGYRPREIEYIVRKPVIRFEGEQSDAYDLLPIARIEMVGAGRPVVSDKFLPPSLSIAAGPLWSEVVSTLYLKASSLVNSLRGKLVYGREDLTVTLNGPDLLKYLKLREILAWLPDLKQFHSAPETHPFVVYSVLARLAAGLGALFKLSPEELANEFPLYSHDSPADGLTRLARRIEQMFALVETVREHELELQPVAGRPKVWSAKLTGHRLDEHEEYFLWTESQITGRPFVEQFLSDVRIAAPKRIDSLLIYGLPGTKLSEVPYPPELLPPPQQGMYFRIDKRDPLWQEIVDEREIMAAASREFPGLRMRLHVLRS